MPADNPTLTQPAPTQEPSLEQVRAALGEPGPDGTAAIPEPASVPPAEGEAKVEETEQPETEAEQESAPEVVLPDGWDSHETVVEKLREAESAGYNKAKSHLTRAHSATLAEIEQAHTAELELRTQQAVAAQAVQTIAEAIADVDLTDTVATANLRKVLQASGPLGQVFLQSQDREAQRNLVFMVTSNDRLTKDFDEPTADEFNAYVSELGLKLRTRIAKATDREEVAKVYADTLGQYLEERDKLRDKIIIDAAIAGESKRLEAEARKAAGLSTRAETREGGAPPVKTSGGGGRSQTVEQELADPTTPIKRLEEIRNRQR